MMRLLCFLQNPVFPLSRTMKRTPGCHWNPRFPKEVDAFVVGHTANPAVLSALQQMGLNAIPITAPDLFRLANEVDRVQGYVQDSDLDVPIEEEYSRTGGNGVMDVMIGCVTALSYILPATHWVSHMPSGLVWVTEMTYRLRPSKPSNAAKEKLSSSFGAVRRRSRLVSCASSPDMAV
ncbi:MAG: hypothetical protein IMW91_07450 [Firmicutes bacterium]|nr:hypothetical protein [Bacillota bacterium]